jgi:hypothetical protein
MKTLEELTCGDFEPLTGKVFLSGEVALTLHLAKELGHQRQGSLRKPFSLLFRGPPGLRAPQGIYRLKNETLGELEIFITQVADGPQGADFEAVFN